MGCYEHGIYRTIIRAYISDEISLLPLAMTLTAIKEMQPARGLS